MLKVSAVPPRRSAVLTVFGGATAINDRTTAELQRSWRCHCGLCRTSTAVAPRIRCDGGITHLTFGSHYIYFPHTHFLFKSRMWHHVIWSLKVKCRFCADPPEEWANYVMCFLTFRWRPYFLMFWGVPFNRSPHHFTRDLFLNGIRLNSNTSFA